nr:DNA polymerase V [Tanacetum cinerariifolium]
MKQMSQLLEVACQERDEARDQHQKLLNMTLKPSNDQQTFNATSPLTPNCFVGDQHHQGPLMIHTKANSSIMESNSLSDAYNHRSSPIFDPIPSLEFSNINVKTPYVQDYTQIAGISNTLNGSSNKPKVDKATMVMEHMIKGKNLPQKGKLVQAIWEAGPLLQTVMDEGPLPRWRNPPPCQTFNILQMDVGVDQVTSAQRQSVRKPNKFLNTPMMMLKQSQPYAEIACSSQMMVTSDVSGGGVLSFGDVKFGSNFQGRMSGGCPGVNTFGTIGKSPHPFISKFLAISLYIKQVKGLDGQPDLRESTFCQPRVHGVWPVLVNSLLPDIVPQHADSATGLNSSKKHKKNRKSSSLDEDIHQNLQNFWEIIIEGSLLLSSHDRKHLAFDVILLILPRLPVSYIPVVLSYKIIQCLVDILSTKESWLYKVAESFLKELLNWVTFDDGRRVAVIMALQKHTNGKFDSITRTKTIKSLMSGFNSELGCMLLIQNLMDMFLDVTSASEEPSDQSQTTDDNSEIGSIEEKEFAGTLGTSEFLKSWVVDSIPGVLKNSKLDNEEKFRVQKEILKFLAVQGLFSSSLGTEVTSFELQEKFRWPKAATSSSLCRMCIEQLQLLLANAQKGEGPHAVASGLEANDLGSYFMRFLSVLRNIPSVSLFRSLSDEDEKAFKKLQEMETQLSREESSTGLDDIDHP